MERHWGVHLSTGQGQRPGAETPSSPSEGTSRAPTFTLDFLLQDCQRTHLCCFRRSACWALRQPSGPAARLRAWSEATHTCSTHLFSAPEHQLRPTVLLVFCFHLTVTSSPALAPKQALHTYVWNGFALKKHRLELDIFQKLTEIPTGRT